MPDGPALPSVCRAASKIEAPVISSKIIGWNISSEGGAIAESLTGSASGCLSRRASLTVSSSFTLLSRGNTLPLSSDSNLRASLNRPFVTSSANLLALLVSVLGPGQSTLNGPILFENGLEIAIMPMTHSPLDACNMIFQL